MNRKIKDMKKIFKSLAVVLAAVLSVSACSKHEILYDADSVTSKMAESQLYNAIPSLSAAETNFVIVVLNSTDTIATANYPLNRYNGIPLGSTTRFFVRTPGDYTIQCFKKAGSTTPDYEGTFTLTAGKQVVYLHSWTAAPIVKDALYPYGQGTRIMSGATSDSLLFVNFVNLWYSATGVATTDKLQYQYAFLINNGKTATLNFSVVSDPQWTNLGNQISFGEQTGFVAIPVPNMGVGYTGGPSTRITSGYITVYTRTVDVNTNTVLPTSIDYWSSIGCGRYYNHIVRGVGRQSYMVSAFASL